MDEAIGDRVTVELLDAGEAEPLTDVICVVYQASFGAPPNSEGPREFEHQRAALTELLRRREFRVAIARVNGRLVGFAYGCVFGAGHPVVARDAGAGAG